jgi:hypothetical protein
MSDLPPKNSRQGFLPERIGSLFIEAPENPRNRNGLRALRLQNRIRSGEVAK